MTVSYNCFCIKHYIFITIVMLLYSTPASLAYAPIISERPSPLILEELFMYDHPVKPEKFTQPFFPEREECNCWLYVNNRLPYMVRMKNFQPNSEALVGGITIEYFGDLKHVALITEVTETGIWVEESNYDSCKTGIRFIPFTKSSLVGFWAME